MADKSWRDDPLENTPPVRGSGEFLKDRGYPDPTATKIKFGLVNAIRRSVERLDLRQIDVVRIVSEYDRTATITQPDVSRILKGNVKGFSESRLMVILAALGNEVSIVVQQSDDGRGRIAVCEPMFA